MESKRKKCSRSKKLFLGFRPGLDSSDPASSEVQIHIIVPPPLREHSRVLSSNLPISKPEVTPEKPNTTFSDPKKCVK